MAIATRRKSKYTDSVRRELHRTQHITNAELVARLRRYFPHISATTVHRITQRLLHDGECQVAPVGANGDMRFDSNVMPHDHFQCSDCGQLRDISLPTDIRVHITNNISNCHVTGSLTIQGSCHACISAK